MSRTASSHSPDLSWKVQYAWQANWLQKLFAFLVIKPTFTKMIDTNSTPHQLKMPHVLKLFRKCHILKLFRKCHILKLFRKSHILKLFRKCHILKLFRKCHILKLFRKSHILKLFRKSHILKLFRKSHILKPQNSSPNWDSNPSSSTGGKLGKQTCKSLHHASPQLVLWLGIIRFFMSHMLEDICHSK